MLIRYFSIVIIVIGVLSVGCSNYSLLDQNWGRSAETARFNQALDPDAGLDSRPVEGIDGQSAVNIVNGYHNSFKQQESSSGNGITVNGSSQKK